MGGLCNRSKTSNAATAAAHTGPKSIKLVLVGDTTVGKSCLIVNYQQQVFSEDYEPNVLDVFTGFKSIDNYQIELEIHDTTGDP